MLEASVVLCNRLPAHLVKDKHSKGFERAETEMFPKEREDASRSQLSEPGGWERGKRASRSFTAEAAGVPAHLGWGLQCWVVRKEPGSSAS